MTNYRLKAYIVITVGAEKNQFFRNKSGKAALSLVTSVNSVNNVCNTMNVVTHIVKNSSIY